VIEELVLPCAVDFSPPAGAYKLSSGVEEDVVVMRRAGSSCIVDLGWRPSG
jgi:hypothetical protein